MARVTTDKARDTGANAVRDMQLRHPGGVAVGAVAVAAAIVLLLVYGFPRLFPAIEGSHPDHFVKNVARALANGNDRQALRIARHATRVRRFDPMTYTMYGRLLLAQGEADAGLDQLDKAICLRKDATPPHQETRKPHYFAPARLTLGTYYLERGQIIEALNQFELARPYARLADPQYADFQALLYQAYAQRTLWARALEFGEPSDRELANLETNNLIRLARVCEGLGSWDLLRRAAERLIERDEFLGEAHYLLGRAGFGEKRYDACLDHLKRAVSDEQPGAAFFLGLALENTAQPEAAVQAFLQAPPGDLYRPFAWAKAAILLETSPEARSDAAMGREKLLDEIDREIARMRKMTPIAEYDTYARLRPVAVMVSAQQFVAGGHFPLLILWEDDQPAVQVAQRLALSRYDDTLILQREPGFILQLQGVENLVN